MLQRLPIALAQVKAENNSQSLLSDNNIIKINTNIEIDNIFINSENSKTSKPFVLILNLTDKLDLRRGKKVVLYQILVFTIDGKT